MSIWVDADACPRVIKDILFRAAERAAIELILVANQPLSTPPSKYIRSVQVMQGFDVADNHIVQNSEAGDLIITGDIPLAAEAIEKGAIILTPRGESLHKGNIGPRLTMRNFMEDMRSAGQISGGPATMNQTERRDFANKLDQWIAKNK
ncbi:YaiI/YqxD family protein [Litoribacillus peritrichatus]|uniref:UPF0178 protein GCM10022277_22430 n=1 Tax=Litoribacillus peritrichatus TaxID=718191 RepID=A0ABP7MPL7_9GAMM